MKKLILLLLISGAALGQVSTQNKITFKAGETPVFAIKAPPGVMEVTFRNTVDISGWKTFKTSDGTITKVGDSLYVFKFTNIETLKREGRGTWQAELKIDGFGIKKTDVFQYEIYKATTVTGNTSPVTGTPYNMVMTWDFSGIAPTFNTIASGLIVVDDASISGALGTKVDKIAGKGLSANDFTNAYKSLLDGLTSNLALKLNVSDTTVLLRKTTAAGLYVAKVTGQSLMTDAERTKLAGVANGATANSTDAQLRDRSTHTGTQATATLSDWTTAWAARFAAQSTSNLAEGSNLYFTNARVLTTILTNVDVTRPGTVSQADNLLQAIGELQAQITTLAALLSAKMNVSTYSTAATATTALTGNTTPTLVILSTDRTLNWWTGTALEYILSL